MAPIQEYVLIEQVKTEAVTALRQIMLDIGLVSGHWLFRVSHTEVDKIWRTLALSAVNGPLSKTAVTRVQVECCTVNHDGAAALVPHEHLVQLHMPNIFEEAPVRNVLLVLLERHGIEPTGVKPDMYTAAGIDSSHPSRIRTTIWRPSELIPGGHTAIKSLIGARLVQEAEMVASRQFDLGGGTAHLRSGPYDNAPPTPPETPRRVPANPRIQGELMQCSLAANGPDAMDRPLETALRAHDVRALGTRPLERPLPIEVTLDDHHAEDRGELVIGRRHKMSFESPDHLDMTARASACAPRQHRAGTVLLKEAEVNAWSMGIAYLDSPGY